ncbi:MAG: hypothetical protein JNJ54_09975 [Myxococcaceae bacterium]|nr:hypothetical protein [Myxococcaceae bacterium]
MRALLRALTLVSFASFVGGAMVAFSQSVRPPRPDAGVDAGAQLSHAEGASLPGQPSIAAVFGESRVNYLAGSKSFGAPVMPNNGLGGLGLRGLVGERPDAGARDAGAPDASVR